MRHIFIPLVVCIVVGLLWLAPVTTPQTQAIPTQPPSPSPFVQVVIATLPEQVAARYAMTKAAADATSLSVVSTAMWVGATGTAVYLAPTETERRRLAQETQASANRTAEAALRYDAYTATAIHKTQMADSARATTEWATAEAAPRAATLALIATVQQYADAQSTRSAVATIAANDLHNRQVISDALVIFVIVLLICIVVSFVVAVGAVATRIEARHKAEAQATLINAQARADTLRMTQTRDGDIIYNGPNGIEIIPVPGNPGLPAIPRAPIPTNGARRAHLDMLSDAARDALYFLEECRKVGTGDDDLYLPGRPKLGMGGDQHAYYIRLLETNGVILPTSAGERIRLARPFRETLDAIALGHFPIQGLPEREMAREFANTPGR